MVDRESDEIAERYERVEVGDPVIVGYGEANWLICFQRWEEGELTFRCTREINHRGTRHVAEGLEVVRSVYQEE